MKHLIFFFFLSLIKIGFSQTVEEECQNILDASYEMETEKAIKAWDKFISKNPTYSMAYVYRAYSKQELNYLDGFEDFQKAVELNPDCAEAYNGIGNYWGFKGEYDKSLEFYQLAFKYDPDPGYLYNIAGAKSSTGDLQGSIEDYTALIESKEPMNLQDALDGRGGVYIELKEFDKAIADLEEVIMMGNNFGGTYEKLGDAYLGNGQNENACQMYKYFLESEDAIMYEEDYLNQVQMKMKNSCK